ncbi:EamA family transporter [Priestia taiwanensis]|uniref:Multidrug transporter n=1 Tax=Priestia taiwanensis TaxID=1347902 RepID=A0A917EQU8_9BACI|nr:DMT family transporter [Priestia taiwanensis]MBM7364272.1 drug/metabolite transporter (DMT)-like permease [Priestia taiwanensis]GGE73106.1 multidrug transporter [Priestia taiwanensis]
MWKYALLVLIGSCSYGVLSTIAKLAYNEGFVASEVVASQYFFGWIFLLVATLLFSRKKAPFKQVMFLMFVGTSTSLTGIFYGLTLEQVTASMAVVLLFQFTWIGIVLEAISERAFPSKEKLFAIAVLFGGTLLAGGVFEQGHTTLNTLGLVYGLLSAVAFALFIFVSGRVATEVPALNRSLYMVTGALILIMFVFSPEFLYNGSLGNGLFKYGLALAVLGTLLPVICFSIASPKVGSGIATILGAVELPVAVLVSMLVLKDNVSAVQWLGIAIIFIGIMIPQFYVRKQKYIPMDVEQEVKVS